MKHRVRSFFICSFAVVALALLPAGASAIDFSLVFNSLQDGGYTNASPVVVPYSYSEPLDSAVCALAAYQPGGDVGPPESKSCSASSVDLGALAEGKYHLVVIGSRTYNVVCIDPFLAVDDCRVWQTNTDQIAGAMDFNVDRTAPAISLTGGPTEGSSSAQTSASFGVSASDGTVSCKLDNVALSCDAIAALTGLSAGAHTLVVTATDQAGNQRTDSRHFTVTATGGGSSGAAGPTGGDSSAGNPTKVTPAITSAPKSVTLGKKIKLGVNCPEGCKIAVAFKGATSGFRGSLAVMPGATSISYSIPKSAAKAIRRALESRKRVTAVFTPNGGVAKKVTIKRQPARG